LDSNFEEKDIYTNQAVHTIPIGVGTRVSASTLYQRIGALTAGKKKRKSKRRKK
jgi:hypothetical protein